jgi:hypothetical protein
MRASHARSCSSTIGRMFALFRTAGGTVVCTSWPRAVAAGSRVLLCLAGLAVLSGPAQASSPQLASLSFYRGQGVDANLIHLVPELLSGDLRYEETFFFALGYYHPLETPRVLQSVFDLVHAPNTRTGWELIAAKHHGLQDNAEIDIAYLLRFSRLTWQAISVQFSFGYGLSYAIGRPTYEDGPVDDRDARYRFQSYGAYELEWGYSADPRFGLVTRIHHRSGTYGLIAPPKVGSNFVTLGLRYSF